ncbi:MAG: hypothetical protein LBR93_11855 [Treponema sp.]|jgi:hypothetical protein|nr:hypothetical protein [Treponema sp.]
MPDLEAPDTKSSDSELSDVELSDPELSDPKLLDPELPNLQKYQNAGASVAARIWSENYDCSNFSTQFYQNCYKAGLPCRVRLGRSGGQGFLQPENHAWNSVKINGEWVDWEPQINSPHSGHTKTATKLTSIWGNYTTEDIARIIYELVGRYVPDSVIDGYEIDTYWRSNSPFYQYFVPYSYCLSDKTDSDTVDLVSQLNGGGYIPNNNSGDIFAFGGQKQGHIFFFFRYNSKIYGIDNLEEGDPIEGRSAVNGSRLTLREAILSNMEFTPLDMDFHYE